MPGHEREQSPDAISARRALTRELRLALKRGEFVPHYQPQVDLTTGTIAGLELLVRWRHPTRGLLPPGAFMPLVEATGLCVPLGHWLLAEACHQLATWQGRYPDRVAPVMAVNLSARHFHQAELVAEVAAILAETSLAPGLLALEVPETAALAQPEAGAAILGALRALGVQLAIDDYGTGQSSLIALPSMPVDALKIDPSFFQEGEHNRTLVRAVTGLARGLGLTAIAEGLETPAQIRWASEAGCTLGQGYYFARPLPAAECEALWERGLHYALP